jgi:hypothetical protein
LVYENNGNNGVICKGLISILGSPFKVVLLFRSLCKDFSSRDMGFIFTALAAAFSGLGDVYEKLIVSPWPQVF